MTTPLTITINGQTYTHNASDAEIAALGEKRVLANAALAEDAEPYADGAAYLQFVIQHVTPEGTPQADVSALIERCLASYAGSPAPAEAPPVVLTGDELKADLRAKATAARQAKVNSGTIVTVGGVGIPVWTDFEAQASFTGAVVGSQVIGSGFAVRWKGRDGSFYTLDGAGMTALALGVMTYVNTQFGIEDVVHQAIEAGTITTTTQIDGAFQ